MHEAPARGAFEREGAIELKISSMRWDRLRIIHFVVVDHTRKKAFVIAIVSVPFVDCTSMALMEGSGLIKLHARFHQQQHARLP